MLDDVSLSKLQAAEASALSAADLVHQVIVTNTPPPPPPLPTYALSVSGSTVDEGQSIVFKLATTHLALGVLVPYTITGVQPADVATGNLTGVFHIEADGTALVNVGVLADALTEGDETLVLTLDGRTESVSVLIKDTSTTPIPPPTTELPFGVLHKEMMNLAKNINAQDLHDRYERRYKLLTIDASTNTPTKIRITGADLSAGGAYRALAAPSYTMYLEDPIKGDGPFAVATVSLTTPAYYVDFVVNNPQAIPDGNYKMTLGDLSTSGESFQSDWVRVHHSVPAVDTEWVPAVKGSYERVAFEPSMNTWTIVPGKSAPQPEPLTRMPDRTQVPTPILNRAELHCEWLTPVHWGDMHRPCISRKGVRSTCSGQSYFWSQYIAEFPSVAVLDGPRGVGAITCATHLEMSTAVVPGMPQINIAYFTDPWRFGKIAPDGTITTLCGWVQSEYPQWQDGVKDGATFNAGFKDRLTLIGDWSAIPPERRGFHELWGMAWDERTFASSTDPADVIEVAPGVFLPAHAQDVVVFLPDSQKNRIIKLAFPRNSHTLPPKVTEHIVAINDPWDCVGAAGVLYVAERKAHRICAYDMITGALLRVVVQGQPLATIDANREVIVSGTLDQRRAAPCVAPEGLFLQDGWLYFASKAQAQVRRVRPDGTGLQVVRPILLDGNSKFAKLALSDGTFGARGMSMTWTWANTFISGPEMWTPFGPNGELPVQILQLWNQSGGTGDWTPHGYYPSAGCAQNGQMLTNGMTEGIKRITKSRAGDLPYTAAVQRGHTEYRNSFYHGSLGEGGYRYYNRPLPWGVSADMDAYLALHHQRA